MGTVSGDSHFLEEQMNPTRIKQYLDSTRDYDKAKGMKWLLAMMSKGRGSRVESRYCLMRVGFICSSRKCESPDTVPIFDVAAFMADGRRGRRAAARDYERRGTPARAREAAARRARRGDDRLPRQRCRRRCRGAALPPWPPSEAALPAVASIGAAAEAAPWRRRGS